METDNKPKRPAPPKPDCFHENGGLKRRSEINKENVVRDDVDGKATPEKKRARLSQLPPPKPPRVGVPPITNRTADPPQEVRTRKPPVVDEVCFCLVSEILSVIVKVVEYLWLDEVCFHRGNWVFISTLITCSK